MRPIIRVENLGKRYRLGGMPGATMPTLREALVQTFRLPAARSRERAADGFVWALKDVNFEVYQGEVVGIIGRNGSGKSTLLKILSRVTKPSAGAADIYGRIGSLLEIGTGFHPDLTGRENVYLNGVLLGMGRAEVERKFDEIVAFAEIDPFLDTPVKRYSSGMYLRLAFAVAAHLESELLLLDEVLAVGDADFQKKCLAKMKDISREGRTALFVSHNMAAVENMCGRVFLLESGMLREEMKKEAAIARYLGAEVISEGSEFFCPSVDEGR